MKKSELKSIIRETIMKELSLHEAEPHTASGAPEYNKLIKLLQAAVRQAEIVGVDAESFPDKYEGSEGADVSYLLEEIWAGFSTGDIKDFSQNDEIFKQNN